jgi:hypothetical protein
MATQVDLLWTEDLLPGCTNLEGLMDGKKDWFGDTVIRNRIEWPALLFVHFPRERFLFLLVEAMVARPREKCTVLKYYLYCRPK